MAKKSRRLPDMKIVSDLWLFCQALDSYLAEMTAQSSSGPIMETLSRPWMDIRHSCTLWRPSLLEKSFRAAKTALCVCGKVCDWRIRFSFPWVTCSMHISLTFAFYIDGECTQTIIHPCVSVWCVATLPNGDIVSGGSDGLVRIFTRIAERVADAATLKAYDEENAAASIPS